MKSVAILNIHSRITAKVAKLGVKNRFNKALELFKDNPFHPSLNTELLVPKSMGIWSFRVNRKVRVLFIFRNDRKAIELLNITVHYH